MNILVLNGSPRVNGSTAAMVQAFAEGAREAGHEVAVIPVGRKKIAGCLGCEYCHTKGNGRCIQKDDEQEVYAALENAEMLVLASPVYYYTLSCGARPCEALSYGMPERVYPVRAAPGGSPSHLCGENPKKCQADGPSFEFRVPRSL